MKILLLGLLLYIILIFSFNATISFKKNEYSLNYNGLLWVILDIYSIWKYKSEDKMMKLFEIKKTK